MFTFSTEEFSSEENDETNQDKVAGAEKESSEEEEEEEVRGASILDWSVDSKTKKAKKPTDDKEEKEAPKKRRGGGRKGGRGGKKGGKKNSAKGQGKFDLSVLKKALKANSENPFTVDYASVMKAFSKKYPTPSGDIQQSSDYAIHRVRTHKGHEVETDPDLLYALRFFHISDTHIDPFFNPYMTSQPGVCASCKLNSNIFGESAYCPLQSPFRSNVLNTKAGYAFGRYKCNPPPQLLASMLANIRLHQIQPAFFLITGGMFCDSFRIIFDQFQTFDVSNLRCSFFTFVLYSMPEFI
jgi:hypothetical protein